MKSTNKELLAHPIILSSIGIVLVIAVASAFYYRSATRVPDVLPTNALSASSSTIVASGEVEAAENPDLAFASGGRVAAVSAKVGEKVARGTVLASLDIAQLGAQRAQASANVAAAVARLAEMKRGARPEDVGAKETAVDQASVALANLYGSVTTNIEQAYDRAFSGLTQNTDIVFGDPNSNNPTLLFSSANSQAVQSVTDRHTLAKSELATWKAETSTLAPGSDRDAVDGTLETSIAHLRVIRTYADELLTVLGSAIPSSGFSQSSIAAAQTSVGSYRDSVNTLVTSLQNGQQQLAIAKLNVRSANDALAQVKAGSTVEQIAAQEAVVAAAQASVAAIDAQIRNATVVATFAGTVASVHVKVGDIVPANTAAVSLNPESALQVVVYLSEIDVTKVRLNDAAQVTLDAYGKDRVFPATVVAVDSAPSAIRGGNTSGYKTTLQFLASNAAIASGMTANITIPTAR